MKPILLFVSVALVSLSHCLPNLPSYVVKSSITAKPTSVGLPIAPSQASSVFKASIATEFIRPKPTATAAFTSFKATPISAKVLPAMTAVPKSNTTVLGGHARLPPLSDISLHPDLLTPYNGTYSYINSTFPQNLAPRQCDPGNFCCPDPRHLFENSQYPWVTIGRTQTISPTVANAFISCTATFIGRRLILTASHCINCKLT